MSIRNEVREPFHYLDVERIVSEQAESDGIEDLKPRVIAKVRETMRLIEAPLPERVRAWIHQICLQYTLPEAPRKMFRGKLAEAIDLASLPWRIQ